MSPERVELVRASPNQQFNSKVEQVRAGEAGHRIVEIARHLRADAIVMPMPHRRSPGKLLNRTLAVVLAKRPCRVIIDSTAARPIGTSAPTVAASTLADPIIHRDPARLIG